MGGRGTKREQPLTLAAGTSPLLEAPPGYSPSPGIVELQEWQCVICVSHLSPGSTSGQRADSGLLQGAGLRKDGLNPPHGVSEPLKNSPLLLSS